MLKCYSPLASWDAAYYMIGYCVECALKACIAKQIRRFDFPDKKLVLDRDRKSVV